MSPEPHPPRGRLDPPSSLAGLPRPDLRSWATAHGLPSYRGDQVFEWLHRRGQRDPEGMANLPGPLREAVARDLGPGLALSEVLRAGDGTRKLLLRTADGHAIESVLIPMGSPDPAEGGGGAPPAPESFTQCLSTQVGCRLGCTFCLTARLGLRRHLGAHEILDQVRLARGVDLGGRPIRNYVFMGMGEPLDNFEELVRACRIMLDDRGLALSGRRITVSTVGLVPRIPALGHAVPVNLALSLNASNDAQRREIMPVGRRHPMAELRAALLAFPLPPRRRITVEYVMLGGFNDAPDSADRLAAFLRGLRVKVNLIPWNPFEGAAHSRPSPTSVRTFQEHLLRHGLSTSIRVSKGLDIGAACGQLDGLASA